MNQFTKYCAALLLPSRFTQTSIDEQLDAAQSFARNQGFEISEAIEWIDDPLVLYSGDFLSDLMESGNPLARYSPKMLVLPQLSNDDCCVMVDDRFLSQVRSGQVDVEIHHPNVASAQSLYTCHITEKSCEVIWNMPRFKSIALNADWIDDETIESLFKQSAIEAVRIRNKCKITASGLASIGNSSNLKFLRTSTILGNRPITDFSALPESCHLHLDIYPGTTDKEMRNLNIHARWLHIGNLIDVMSDCAFEAFPNMANVRHLHIDIPVGATELALEYIGQMQQLRSLEISKSQISTIDFDILCGLPKLQRLDVSAHDQGIDVSAKDLEQLNSISQLQKLHLCGLLNFTNDHLKILSTCHNLQAIELCAWIDCYTRIVGISAPDIVENLCQLESLQKLRLTRWFSPPEPPVDARPFSQLKKLDSLIFGKCHVDIGSVNSLKSLLPDCSIECDELMEDEFQALSEIYGH